MSAGEQYYTAIHIYIYPNKISVKTQGKRERNGGHDQTTHVRDSPERWLSPCIRSLRRTAAKLSLSAFRLVCPLIYQAKPSEQEKTDQIQKHIPANRPALQAPTRLPSVRVPRTEASISINRKDSFFVLTSVSPSPVMATTGKSAKV
jgi:hypothetical protein